MVIIVTTLIYTPHVKYVEIIVYVQKDVLKNLM